MRFKEIRDFYFEYRAFLEESGIDKEAAREKAFQAYLEKLTKYFGVRPAETMRTMTLEERFISYHPEMFGLADNSIFGVRMRVNRKDAGDDDVFQIAALFIDFFDLSGRKRKFTDQRFAVQTGEIDIFVDPIH